uniref:Uncharacterized protein n=1 Tax=Amphimedon queenslandica TaxID=400682 RepID=A0A1X7V3D0_AMPQE
MMVNLVVRMPREIIKKDDVIYTYEEPPNPDIVRRQGDYVYYPPAETLAGSPTTPLLHESVPSSTLDVLCWELFILCAFMTHNLVNFSVLRNT